ncbi:50S ribosomal protein L6 [Candidatus Roizmanbacteria bacterium RIFCSPHIGHO2_02_FULL_40_13b]|uniref:50S ribosomal protein L6 n=1 Tax=Candidatus Roizmanbacteria bacterium RIFCSPHIGHO2_01_FULL_39_24 TaxID=1802032 RepID=A0A1F7GL53_9BACT|nr:MAG: 50S ribosomal protein L6 [Candidatus Roizmanbacteria bacterium RIFCSPHIGHO2_01_FULL_39_24]OGK27817.1 MAG: 50S ribosomal protein L6 [Candidatus Roizmanbacteria bacterium RIFCSPHIGHO2_02_FULL_40_13b]OGK49959.1 MAG: 50S ribosomal protein L6 [Candidatus Roizmanbacteria bacterium RIFCSPLOWO2_01_FULL_40_32]OGK55964.1 MAG: 50S ribosomal protein L6 [Candidatus Roizmanbacteria bacterium RIFCSPLOWO2_02_FULL_39_8]
MSKVGQSPITVQDPVSVSIENQTCTVTGPLGSLVIDIPREITVTNADGVLAVARRDDLLRSKALHGLTRTLVQNAVLGVVKPWEKKLEVHGTGYRVKQMGENLVFEVGYSHTVEFGKVKGVTLAIEGNNKVTVSGIDKQRVGEVAAKIKAIKKPDPYKGKGVRYEGEVVHLKAGKKAKTA